ncbi:MAG: DUF5777 family beta-barrel protein [Bacteroidia bacterium]|nr:DUF5777 family beta-barrel protein [Bacteroidia bacterium]
MKNLRQKLLCLVFWVGTCSTIFAQQSTESEVTDTTIVENVFRSSRLINQHTTYILPYRILDFRISHRFGEFNTGPYNFYGLDGPANIALHFEYSPIKNGMFGIARSSLYKMYHGFVKYQVLSQRNNGKMPISLTLFMGAYVNTSKNADFSLPSHRWSYVNQIMASKKLENVTVQIGFAHVHYNLVKYMTDKNTSYYTTAGLRWQFNKYIALTGEYAYKLQANSRIDKLYNNAGIGLEIQTFGHVFQMHVTNAFGIFENQALAYTTTQWTNGGIRFGFNVSRYFGI